MILCTSDPSGELSRQDVKRLIIEQLHSNGKRLVKQQKGYCGIYSVLNSFDSMDEICQFLNIEKKEVIEEKDLAFLLGIMKDKPNYNINKHGFGHEEIDWLLRNPAFRDAVGIERHIFKSTYMDLQHVLTTERKEGDVHYYCEGVACSSQDKRDRAVKTICKYLCEEVLVDDKKTEVEEPAVEEAEVEEPAVGAGSKRKCSADDGPLKKAKKANGTADYQRRKAPKDPKEEQRKQALKLKCNKIVRDNLTKGILEHSQNNYHVSGPAGSKHAMLIYYNSDGIPVKCDPGLTKMRPLLSHADYLTLTREDIVEGVTEFVTSSISLDCIYKLKIFLKKK